MEKYYFKIDYKETASGPTRIIYISIELETKDASFDIFGIEEPLLSKAQIDTLIRNKLFHEKNINIIYFIESVQEDDIPLKRLPMEPRITFEY